MANNEGAKKESLGKILIVEDEKPIRRAASETFKDANFEIFEAGDGEEGLKIALSEKPDMILLDLMMPKMDGMAFLKELRKDNWGKGVEIILLTNVADVKKVSEAMKYSVYDYMVKSNWTLEDVVSKVKKKMGITN